jgi:predicted small secreted protein
MNEAIDGTADPWTIRQENVMRKWIMVIGLIISTLGLSACNTMHGFGQDVERGGEKVQNAADRSK